MKKSNWCVKLEILTKVEKHWSVNFDTSERKQKRLVRLRDIIEFYTVYLYDSGFSCTRLTFKITSPHPVIILKVLRLIDILSQVVKADLMMESSALELLFLIDFCGVFCAGVDTESQC